MRFERFASDPKNMLPFSLGFIITSCVTNLLSGDDGLQVTQLTMGAVRSSTAQ